MTNTLNDSRLNDSRLNASKKRADRAKPKQHRRAPLIAVLLLVALSITLAGIFPFRQLIAQERQVEKTREKLEALQSENTALDDQIAALQSDAEIERLAREKHGLVNPGETPYSVTNPGAEPKVPPPPVFEAAPDERSLLQQMWDWMTGRDLYPDG